MKKRMPALTLSGGKLNDFGKPVRYRIWVHFREDKDDGYYEFLPGELEKANLFRKKLLKDKRYAIVEPVIAVVWDKKFKRYREVSNK
mgnify:CR=1 FL=1